MSWLLWLICMMLVSLSVGLLKKFLLLFCVRCSIECWMVVIDCVLIRLYLVEMFLCFLVIRLSRVCRLFMFSSSRSWLLVSLNMMLSILVWVLFNLRMCVSRVGFILLIVVCIGWFSLLYRFKKRVGLVVGVQLVMLILVVCWSRFLVLLLGMVRLEILFFILVRNIGMFCCEKFLVRVIRVMVLLVLVVLVIRLWWLLSFGSRVMVILLVMFLLSRIGFMVQFL